MEEKIKCAFCHMEYNKDKIQMNRVMQQMMCNECLEYWKRGRGE